MPKPFFLQRSSGLYVRFLVPAKLRACIGSRFLIRPLYLPPGDVARLAAARMGVALFELFNAMEATREKMDRNELDELLRKASAGELSKLTLKDVRLPGGALLGHVQVDTPQDSQLFSDILNNAAPRVVRPRLFVEEKPEPEAPKVAPSLSLSKAIADHLADSERANLHNKTVLESRHSLRLFAGAVGDDVPVSSLSQDHVRAFFDVVRWWPANATKRLPYRDMVDVHEVVAAAKANGEPAPAAWTQAKHRQRLSVFLVSLVAGGHLERNPLQGVRSLETPDTEDTGAPFTAAQLQALFEPAPFTEWASKWPHRWFGTILGLYSGARVTEVAQLRVEDVEAVDGVQGFYVRAAAEGQRVKNKNSRRFVPLAGPVLAAGFLDYVAEVKAAGHERIFPNLPGGKGLSYGRQLSRQFSTYAKARGVDEKGQGFHGFRHTFASLLDAAGATPSAIGALTGHARGQSVLERHYIDRGSLPDRVATLARFIAPVELPAYTPGQFSEELKRAAVLARRVASTTKTKTKTPA